jgi:prepilin-type processing-associated H-X9-DG protein
MNNLRQIGLATQTYLNDNDGVLFTPSSSWPATLKAKYIDSWKAFFSPFQKTPSYSESPPVPVSYGMNVNAKTGAGTTVAGISADKITNPSAFIVFAAAPNAASASTFSGTSTTPSTVDRPAISPPLGTHNRRQRINASMADWHVENIAWTTYAAPASTDTTSAQRWTP